jgi:hypothetical protein
VMPSPRSNLNFLVSAQFKLPIFPIQRQSKQAIHTLRWPRSCEVLSSFGIVKCRYPYMFANMRFIVSVESKPLIFPTQKWCEQVGALLHLSQSLLLALSPFGVVKCKCYHKYVRT